MSDRVAATPTAQVILPFPAPLVEASAFRSTWLASSLAALRELELFDSYLAELPAKYHDELLLGVAGVWIPIEVATEHYSALERMNLSAGHIDLMGRAVTRRVQGTAFSTLLGLVKQSGATPWTAMMQFNRFWERVWQGGGVRITKLGPKDALIELGGWPLAQFNYVTLVMPRIAQAVVELFSRRAFARLAPERSRRNVVAIQVSWV